MSLFKATFANNLKRATEVRSQHEPVLRDYVYDLDTEGAAWIYTLSDATLQKLLDRSTGDYLTEAGHTQTAGGTKYLFKAGDSKQDFPNKVFTIVLTDTAERFGKSAVFRSQLVSEAKDLQGKAWYFRGVKRDPAVMAYFSDRLKAVVTDLLVRD
jgi:hypothetical protein